MSQFEFGRYATAGWVAAFLWAAVLPQVAAQDHPQRNAVPWADKGANIEAFGAQFVAGLPAPREQVRIVLYRTGPKASSEPINIYLNSRYHVSLLQGGFSEFCVEPGTVAFQSEVSNADQSNAGMQRSGQSWTFQKGRSFFLKILESGLMAEVDVDLAERELALNAQQIHTLSRSPLIQVCQKDPPVLVQAPTAVPPPPAVEIKPWRPTVAPPRLYALESDALFEFGKSELRASSYNAIEVMVQRLKRDFSSVERIRVVGHTDSIGQAKPNAKLSMARAKVVAQQLKERGLKPSKGFKIEGEGATNLIKLRCGNKPTSENKQCHAPNRRVDIVVTGARR